jgi:HK97 family phage major capsid protein
MTDLAEIKGMVEKINPLLVGLRSEVDELKGSVPKDPLTEEKWNAMLNGKDGKKGLLDQMQELQDAQAALKAKMERPGTGEGKGGQEAEERKKLQAFFQTGEHGKKSGRGETIEIKAMSTQVDPMGGFLVLPSLSATVVDRIFETSPVRQLANVEMSDSTTHILLIDDDEAAARWVGEGASGGETDTPDVGRKTIALHKIEADPRMTVEQTESAYINAEAWLSAKVADKFARTENTAFVNGTGVNQPRGFMTYDAWAVAGTYERNKIEQINCGASSALTADGLITLQNGLKEAYQMNATWGMKRATFGAALKLKGADQYHFSPVLLRDGQASIQLLGKPIVFMDDMPAVGSNALPVVYADFSRAYTIVDGPGLTVLRDPYTAKGFITYYTTKRVAGDVSSFDAIKIGKTPS